MALYPRLERGIQLMPDGDDRILTYPGRRAGPSQTPARASGDQFSPPSATKLTRTNASFLDSMKMNDTLTPRWFTSRDSSGEPTDRFGLIHPKIHRASFMKNQVT